MLCNFPGVIVVLWQCIIAQNHLYSEAQSDDDDDEDDDDNSDKDDDDERDEQKNPPSAEVSIHYN